MENAIAWIFIFPLIGSVACAILGISNRKVSYPIAVFSMVRSLWAGIETLMQVISSKELIISYLFGGWTLDAYPRGVGIEFHADILGILMTLVVLGVGLIVAFYSKLPLQDETPGKESLFYTLFLLQITRIGRNMFNGRCI